MNMKRATTVEQSKRLLNIEIDPKSADHILLNFGDGEYQLDVLLEGEEVSDKDLKDGDLPAWSLGSLIDILPENLVEDGCKYEFFLKKTECGYYNSELDAYLISFENKLGEDELDTLIRLVEWYKDGQH